MTVGARLSIVIVNWSEEVRLVMLLGTMLVMMNLRREEFRNVSRILRHPVIGESEKVTV